MKKSLLSFVVAALATLTASAQTFEFGTATWNVEDDKVFESAEALKEEGIVLSYPNASNYTLTPLHMLSIDYDLYVDDNPEPLKLGDAGRASTSVTFSYQFVDGHKYRIVTTGAYLIQVNLATLSPDTLFSSKDVYSKSFSIKGTELVATLDVEAKMALTITDQNYWPTVSLVDTAKIISALGINSLSEAAVYGLNLNGSYNKNFGADGFDGWRDNDGEFTTYNGGWSALLGHNAYPAVYSIKLTDKGDSVLYYFYDYWTEYDPEAEDEIGSSTSSVRNRAPQTTYNYVIWDWENEDGTITKYKRQYRVNEGSDYKSSFVFVANGKSVLLNATLHFVSQDDYVAYLKNRSFTGTLEAGLSMPSQAGVPVGQNTQAQTVTVKYTADDKADITFSGFSFPMMPMATGEFTVNDVTVTNTEDGIVYSSEGSSLGINMGAMTSNYRLTLNGTQSSLLSAPEFVITLSQASIVTAVFSTSAQNAKERLASEYSVITSVDSVESVDNAAEFYGINGVRLSSPEKGIVIIRKAGKTIKTLVK